MFIADLKDFLGTAGPGTVGGLAALELRRIKEALQDSFPNFDSTLNDDPETLSNWTNIQDAVIGAPDDYLKIQNGIYILNERAKELMIAADGKVSLSEPLIPIGSVYQTPLTPEQVDSLYGPDVFQEMDGSSVNNTVFATIFGTNNIVDVPDLFQGIGLWIDPVYQKECEKGAAYLWPSASDAANELGTYTVENIGRNGLSFTGADTSAPFEHNHYGGTHWHDVNDMSSGYYSYSGWTGTGSTWPTSGFNEIETDNADFGGTPLNPYSHEHGGTLQTWFCGQEFDVSGNDQFDPIWEGVPGPHVEPKSTEPSSINLYHYIRIN